MWASSVEFGIRAKPVVGDPSLRLKNGYAQDDNLIHKWKLNRYRRPAVRK